MALHGVLNVGDLLSFLQSPIIQRSAQLSRKAAKALLALPANWLAEGPMKDNSIVLVHQALGWHCDRRGLSEWQPLSTVCSTHKLRLRAWSLKYGEVVSFNNFVPSRCWRGLLDGCFDWKLAFTRIHCKGRPPLNSLHTDICFRVLHGLIMANRPIGRWGRPECFCWRNWPAA